MGALLNSRQTANLIGVTPGTMSRWRQNGAGPPYAMMGKRPVYARSVVLRWMEEQGRKPALVS